MTCRRVRRLLSVRREVAERERATVESHLNGCPSCYAVAREYQLMERRLERLPQPVSAMPLPAVVHSRVNSAVRTMRPSDHAWRRHVVQGMGLITVAALIVVAAWVWRGQYPLSIPELSAALTDPQSETRPEMGQLLDAQLGDQIRLLGYDLEPGVPPRLILYWQAVDRVEPLYSVFVHLQDGDSRVWGQQDTPVGRGALPATGWMPGELVVDEHEIAISSSAPSGDYAIAIGMYGSETGERLPVTSATGDSLGTTVEIEGRFYWFRGAEDGSSEFAWPTAGYLTQTFWAGHQAIDIAAQSGTPVTAAAGGTVVSTGDDAEYGIHVLLDHENGYSSLYAHLNGTGVEVGDDVARGQQIGVVGSTGKSTGPHLHFEIRRNGLPMDPFEVVTGETRSGGAVSSDGTRADADRAEGDTADLTWPVSGRVTQGYWIGHKALDIANAPGTPVGAVADGTVTLASQDGERHGIHLMIDHGDGYESFYSHLSAAFVEVGQQVKVGQQIGAVGSTGMSTGPHLHLEIRRNGVRLNPFDLLPEVPE